MWVGALVLFDILVACLDALKHWIPAAAAAAAESHYSKMRWNMYISHCMRKRA
jgi:hypothetical protein